MNFNLPRISITTPSYNHSKYLETTIKSVLGQNYPNLEYFVIDGGSNDGTQEIIQKYSDKITFWTSEKDEGQSDAIRKGFSMSSGEILGWINSDDAYFPNALTRIGLFFHEHPEADLVTGGIAFTNENGNVYKCYDRPNTKLWFAKRGLLSFAQQATFFRKEIYDRVGGIRSDFHYKMDTELVLNIMFNGGAFYSLRGLYGFWRIHKDIKTLRKSNTKVEEGEIIRKKYGFKTTTIENEFNRLLFRFIQSVNGNYIISLVRTLKYHGMSIDEIWNW